MFVLVYLAIWIGICVLCRCQRDKEAEKSVSATYLVNHQNTSEFVSPQMRLIVVSWMVEVADEFCLQQETLHLAVSLLDRFLSSTQVLLLCPQLT